MARTFAPSLEALFLMLRAAGIPVGIEEIARLQMIFALTPVLDRTGLRRVLHGALVKSVAERGDFDRTFDKWLTTLDGELSRIETLRSRTRAVPAKKAAVAQGPARPGAQTADRDGQSAKPAAQSPLSVSDGRDDLLDDLFDAPPVPEEPPTVPGPSESSVVSVQAGPATRSPTTSSPQVKHGGRSEAKAGDLRRLMALVMLMLTLGIALWVLVIRSDSGSKSDDPILEAADAGPVAENPDAGVNMNASRDTRMAVPELRVESMPAPERNPLGYIVASLAMALVFWLWARFGGGSWMPPDRHPAADDAGAGARAERGPPRRRSLETLILDERDEEELIWGVGRFVSEERSRDLDINRSVRDTASAYGRPVLHYQGSEHQREVWLWIDESLDSPVARQLADDLSLMLTKSGLPVTRATFWGLPERLRSERDESMTLDAFDARRDSAAVAILTDGRMLSLAHRARNRRGDIENLLRTLSYWPRITFIDFGSDRLTPLCQNHGLRVIKPQDAACAISELTEVYERPIEYDALVGDARVWLAACALSPSALPERAALAVRRELALDVSPWQIGQMRDHARDDAGRMGFTVAQRAAHLAWLLSAEDVPTRSDRLPRTSLLRRIVQAWERVLGERAQGQARALEKRGMPWAGCAAERALAIDRACIQLWAYPDQAAVRLYRLYNADEHGARASIRAHLAHLGGRERLGADDIIALPWPSATLRRSTRVILHDMGLGCAGAAPARMSMPAPGHVWLALGLCAGLLVGAVTALIEQWTPPPKPPPVFVDDVAAPAEVPGNAFQRIDTDRLVAEVAIPGMAPVQQAVQRGDKVTVNWQSETMRCEEQVGRTTLMRCPQGPEGRQRENWSFAILAVEYDGQAENIARELLSSGSVDGVYRASSAEAMDDIPLAQLARSVQKGAPDQLLIVAARAPASIGEYRGVYVVIGSDQLGLLSGVTDDYEGWRTLKQTRARLDALHGVTSNFRVRGTGPCGGRGQRCCTEPEEGCTGVLQCNEGQCMEPECTHPGSECQGDVAVTCTEELTLEREQCDPSEVCELGACLPRQCRPDTLRCLAKGTEYKRCLRNGTAWSEREQCPSGSLCDSGAIGCQPLAGAVVQFTTIRHSKAMRRRGNFSYRLRCSAIGGAGSGGLNMRLATGDPVVQLKNNPRDQVSYAASPDALFIECTVSDIRDETRPPTSQNGKPGAPTRLGRGSERKRHTWTLGLENKLHRLPLKHKGARYTVTIEYRVRLLLGGTSTGAAKKPPPRRSNASGQPGASR